jgi:hypothetical protein
MMSLIRSSTVTKPSRSIVPMSPLRSQPSTNAPSFASVLDLALVVDPYLVDRHGYPDRIARPVLDPARWCQDGGRAGFRHPVADAEVDRRRERSHAVDERAADERAATHAHTQVARTQVARSCGRQRVDRRCGVEERGLPGREQLGKGLRVEVAHDGDGAAGREYRQRLAVQAGGMEHRRRDDRRLLGPEVETSHVGLRCAHQVQVRLEHAFRTPCRSRGEHEQRRVFRSDLHGLELTAGVTNVREHVRVRIVWDLLQPLRLDEDDARRALRQLLLELGPRVLRVQRDSDAAHPPGRDQADEQVEAVRGDEGDAVARTHAETLLQRAGHLLRLLPELLVRKGSPADLAGRRRGTVPLEGALDQVAERLRLLRVHAQAVALDDLGGTRGPYVHRRVLRSGRSVGRSVGGGGFEPP